MRWCHKIYENASNATLQLYTRATSNVTELIDLVATVGKSALDVLNQFILCPRTL